MKQITSTVIICLLLFSCTHVTKKEKATHGQTKNTVYRPEPIICFDLKIKLLKEDKTYVDTIINVRKSVTNDSTIMVGCDTSLISIEMEKMLLKCKYLAFSNGYCSTFFLCKKKGKKTEVSQYFYKSETTEAREIRRFLIINSRIVGIIFLPGIIDEYSTIEECELHDRMERVD
jgi:hypothetical protein